MILLSNMMKLQRQSNNRLLSNLKELFFNHLKPFKLLPKRFNEESISLSFDLSFEFTFSYPVKILTQ